MNGIRDKVAIVTGATSGIGRATAEALAAEGAHVVLAGRRCELGEHIALALRRKGFEAVFAEVDVRDPASLSAMVEIAIHTYGHLDIAVNNAGIPGKPSPLHDCPQDDWDEVLSVNLKGVWLSMKFEIPYMLRNGAGVVVNVASDVGLVGSDLGIAPYVASKHGVIGLTRAAALEYATRSIRVNAICPGLTDTPMLARAKQDHSTSLSQYIESHIPMKRSGTAEEQASAIVWLCSDASSFVTGHALVVDGGILAK